MKINLYTDIDTLFGDLCRACMDMLVQAGHEVELVDIGMDNHAPLPDVGPASVNLMVAGIYAWQRFQTWGLPRHGKNVLWVFDPLTRNDASIMHRHKAVALDAIAAQLDAVLAMNTPIASYLALHHPQLLTLKIPYLIADKRMASPVDETLRRKPIIFLGGQSPHRVEVESHFAAHKLAANFVCTSLWGKQRDDWRRHCCINLSLHAETKHTYFDQFRALETWAAGAVVLTETTDGLAEFGIQPGVHLAMTDWRDMPGVCSQLLLDKAHREQMTVAAQELLREQFSMHRWKSDLLRLLSNLP